MKYNIQEPDAGSISSKHSEMNFVHQMKGLIRGEITVKFDENTSRTC